MNSQLSTMGYRANLKTFRNRNAASFSTLWPRPLSNARTFRNGILSHPITLRIMDEKREKRQKGGGRPHRDAQTTCRNQTHYITLYLYSARRKKVGSGRSDGTRNTTLLPAMLFKVTVIEDMLIKQTKPNKVFLQRRQTHRGNLSREFQRRTASARHLLTLTAIYSPSIFHG